MNCESNMILPELLYIDIIYLFIDTVSVVMSPSKL